MSDLPRYDIQRCFRPPSLSLAWEVGAWEGAQHVELNDARPASSSHLPRTLAKAVYDDTAIHVAFIVEDRHMHVANETPNSPVYKDSCVEFFFAPSTATGYFNFEFNCAGVALMRHNRSREDYDWLTPDEFSSVSIFTDGPRKIQDTPDPITWRLSASIPWALIRNYYKDFKPRSGTLSRANFYKCCDECSKPHWMSWSSVGESLSFHQPKRFGEVTFL